MAEGKPIRIFKDKELTEEIEDFHFGKVEIGKKATVSFYIQNVSRGILENLEISFPTPEGKQIKVVKMPKVLKQGEVGQLILEWSPSPIFRQGFRTTIQIEGEEVFYAPIK